MTSSPVTTRLRQGGLILALVLAVSACGGTTTPTGTTASTSPTIGASRDPNAPVTNPPAGPRGSAPGSDGFVQPKPGQLDVHPVAMTSLNATVDGRHVTVTAAWTSGVEPCSTLDSIVVDRGDHTFTLTIREGHGPEAIACIEIAMFKQARVDLGELEPGAYTISDSQGGATPIEVVVS